MEFQQPFEGTGDQRSATLLRENFRLRWNLDDCQNSGEQQTYRQYTKRVIVYTNADIDVMHFDFEKAFDCASYLRMLHKLNELGIVGSLHSWIQSCLTKRAFLVNIGEEHSKCIGVVSEFPQDCLLTRYFLAMQK